MRTSEEAKIKSRDYWLKIVGFLQHNRALIEENADSTATIYFIGDTSRVFDRRDFPNKTEAESGLRRNGFKRYEDYDQLTHEVIPTPEPPFYLPSELHTIYSSGEFWKS
jgi:hypothetical protein